MKGMKGNRGKVAMEKLSPSVTGTRSSTRSRKHFLSGFVQQDKLGCVRRSTFGEIRAEFQLRSATVLRPLGPPVVRGSQESVPSGNTYFLEGTAEETELFVLQENLRKHERFASVQVAPSTLLGQLPPHQPVSVILSEGRTCACIEMELPPHVLVSDRSI